MDASRYAYIGTTACGCTVAMIDDMPENCADTAQAVYTFIVWGLTVTRVGIDEARRLFRTCPHQTYTPLSNGKRLYEVHHFVLSYALATSEDEAEEILAERLFGQVIDRIGMMGVSVKRATTVDPEYISTYPWSEDGEDRTCGAILEAQAAQDAAESSQLSLAIDTTEA